MKHNQPALQNIPIRTELGEKIRKAFSDPIMVMHDASYSEIERSMFERYRTDHCPGTSDKEAFDHMMANLYSWPVPSPTVGAPKSWDPWDV